MQQSSWQRSKALAEHLDPPTQAQHLNASGEGHYGGGGRSALATSPLCVCRGFLANGPELLAL